MQILQITTHLNIKSSVKLKILIVIVLLSLNLSKKSYAQHGIPVGRAGASTGLADSSTIVLARDTTNLKADSTSTTDSTVGSQIPISPDAIESKIVFHVPDSAVVDNTSKVYKFYGVDVTVEMDDIKLQSPYVIYHQDSSTLYAYSLPDSVEESEALFSQAEESFGFEEIKYNFDSKKAIVVNAKSQYDEGYIYSDKIKRNNDNTIYGLENVYTTCSAPDPHFSIVSHKIKIIPDRVVVSGPARLQIAGIPTPLILPFALFPLSKGQKSGFILPTYDISPQWGVGLQGMGYYLALNENMDLKLTGSIYSYGTWSAMINSNYIKRYRHQGSFTVGLGSTITGDRNTEDYQENKTFNVSWRHSIDPKILRGYRFSADVTYMSPQYYRNTTYNNEKFLQNSTNSNITLNKSWTGTPFNFSLNLKHYQNNATHKVDLTLPSFVFNMRQIQPFKRKITSSNPKWYEKINIGYSLNANNVVSFTDTLLAVDDPSSYQLKNAIYHHIPINANYKILKYINFQLSSNFREYWNTKKSIIQLDENTNQRDTTEQTGFFATRSIDARVSLSNTVYGLFKFRSKKLKAIRHQLISSISYNVAPDYTEDRWNTYYMTKLDTADTRETAVPYYFSSFGSNYARGGKQGALNFRLNNNVEMKIRDKNDSSGYKKSGLIDIFDISSDYNFIADSFKLGNLNLQFSTKILKQIQLVARAVYSPYDIDTSSGRQIDRYLWQIPDQNRLVRMNTMQIEASGGLNSKMFSDTKDEREAAIEKYIYTDYLSQYVDFDIPWTVRLNYTHSINNAYDQELKKWEIIHNPSLTLNGDFNLTQRWKFEYRFTYDFKDKQIDYTNLNVYRDLHCWELRIGAIPYGIHRSFNISLNVKAAVLQDLRIQKRQDFIDNF